MSILLHYQQAVQPGRLNEELLAALPQLATTTPDGLGVVLYGLRVLPGSPPDVWLTVPDATPTATVDAVLAAHDGTTPWPATRPKTLADLQADWDAASVDLADALTAYQAAKNQFTTDLATLSAATTLATFGPPCKAALTDLGQGMQAVVAGLEAAQTKQLALAKAVRLLANDVIPNT